MSYIFISDYIICWQFSTSWHKSLVCELYSAIVPTVEPSLQKCMCVC